MVLPDTKTRQQNINRANTAANVFAEYEDFIRTVIRYQVKNETQVDDLFQDFFLSLVSKPIPIGVRNIKSYLYKAITNDIIDAARRVEKYQKHMRKYAKHFNYSIDKRTPENLFIKEEETSKIFETIEMQLRHSEAQAIILRYRHNYNTKEVARKMNVDSSSVRRYVSIGFNKIRQFLTNNKVRY